MQHTDHPSPVRRIFVIDPSPDVRNLIKETLTSQWVVSLDSYPDAQEALLKISEHKVMVPNFVFLNLDPRSVTNGYQAITSFCAFSSIVFAILNKHNPLQAHNARQAGARATIEKPLSRAKVLNLANTHIPR